MSDMERSYLPAAGGGISIRVAAEEGQPKKIEARVAVYNKWSPLRGGKKWGWREMIEPGFFSKCLEQDVPSLFDHDTTYILGRTKSGTCTLTDSADGLDTVTTPPDTQTIRDLVIVPIERNDIVGCSFAFSLSDDPDADDWQIGPDQVLRRVLKAGGCETLWDVTPACVRPFYTDTSVSLKTRAERSLEKLEAEQRGKVDFRETLMVQNALLRLRG